jgi:hypothetical protein
MCCDGETFTVNRVGHFGPSSALIVEEGCKEGKHQTAKHSVTLYGHFNLASWFVVERKIDITRRIPSVSI